MLDKHPLIYCKLTQMIEGKGVMESGWPQRAKNEIEEVFWHKKIEREMTQRRKDIQNKLNRNPIETYTLNNVLDFV